jgi:hypothetical protein
MNWTAVAFATREYDHYVAAWEKMITDLGGRPIVVKCQSTGDWARNTGLKPSAILSAWSRVKEDWFLYLDIDVLLTAVPELPAGAWHVGVTDNLVSSHKNRISAADLIFKKTPEALRFLRTWQLKCKQRPGKDHDHLTQAIRQCKNLVRNITGSIGWVQNGLLAGVALKELETLPESQAVILFKYPSRGRPEHFFRSLDSIVKENYHVAATLDLDDEAMNTPEIRARLESYSNLSVQWGHSCSKIHAVNRDMPDVPWSIVVNMSDDMVFNRCGFDTCIRKEMARGFPNNDGLLHFPDQDAGRKLATLYIAGRGFYDKFGYIYHPGFKSLWCDNLVQEVAQKLDRYLLLEYDINVHLNPAYGYVPKDAMFRRQQLDWDHDEKLYLQIKKRGYDLKTLA